MTKTPDVLSLSTRFARRRQGCAVVVQNTRGRYTSESELAPFLSDTQDGDDTVEWCATVP
jgi:uncharacterized protein